jgi:hypothetical protein
LEPWNHGTKEVLTSRDTFPTPQHQYMFISAN